MTEPIRLAEVAVRLHRPLQTRFGPLEERRSILVGRGDEPVGWGEAPALPSARFGSAEETWDAFTSGGEMTPVGRAALEAARLDREARLAGVPLHTHLGGTARPIVARHPVGLTSPAEVEDLVAELERRGLRAIKLKIGPGQDVDTMAALRDAAPWLDIGVDANGAYDDPQDAAFDALEGTAFIEQPLAVGDPAAARPLIERGLTIAFDEELDTPEGVEAVLGLGSGAMMSIKLNRHGWAAFESLRARSIDHGIAVRVGGTFDTSIGRRHILAAATLPGVTDGAAGPPSAYLASDVAPYPELVDGMVEPTDGPGIGIEPDSAALDASTIRSRTVELG